uniref:Beta-amylase n=1 Tax=Oryza meridionalis TaxID=40149 RepID=A0A0E0C7W1_9ORYZ
MAGFLDSGLIVDIEVGLGLQIPILPSQGWEFPGIGQIPRGGLQSGGDRSRAPEVAAGEYNDTPEDTFFFTADGGTYLTEAGRFFLTWYSNKLLEHGDKILDGMNMGPAGLLTPRGCLWPRRQPPTPSFSPAWPRRPSLHPPASRQPAQRSERERERSNGDQADY